MTSDCLPYWLRLCALRYAWVGHQGSYPGGKKDKYSVIFEAFDEGQSQVRASDDL